MATIRVNRRQMGHELMARLLAQVTQDDFVASVELIERASLQAPETTSTLPVYLGG